MVEYEWAELRTHAIRAFGNTAPGAELEEAIIHVFAINPAGVKNAIDYTANEWAKGKITSPWAILRTQCQRLIDTSTNVTATDERGREKAIAKAENWIRNAGYHMDRESEVVDYLFGVAEFTPELEYLEALELETRGRPGRQLYEGLLLASIERTRNEGVQQVPGTHDGPLKDYRTTKTRDRMINLWRELRHQGEQVEREALERADRWVAQNRAATQAAAGKPRTKKATLEPEPEPA